MPIVDTPGTSDANSLNADVTHEAVDDATTTSSQLLLCGEKTLETEGSLAEYAITYFKHMITSPSGRPAIKGILMPPERYYMGPLEMAEPAFQTRQKDDNARIAKSMAQLGKWLRMANQDLPLVQKASNAKLDNLLQRCEVRVVYMQLYTSLSLQTTSELAAIADDVKCNVEQLLARTNGPWLMSKA